MKSLFLTVLGLLALTIGKIGLAEVEFGGVALGKVLSHSIDYDLSVGTIIGGTFDLQDIDSPDVIHTFIYRRDPGNPVPLPAFQKLAQVAGTEKGNSIDVSYRCLQPPRKIGKQIILVLSKERCQLNKVGLRRNQVTIY